MPTTQPWSRRRGTGLYDWCDLYSISSAHYLAANTCIVLAAEALASMFQDWQRSAGRAACISESVMKLCVQGVLTPFDRLEGFERRMHQPEPASEDSAPGAAALQRYAWLPQS